MKRRFSYLICSAVLLLLVTGCKKWIEIDPPVDTITTPQMFASDKEAEWAMAAVYSKLINGVSPADIARATDLNFGSGLPTLLGGLSADDLVMDPRSLSGDYLYLSSNNLRLQTSGITVPLWNTAYKAIFDANGVIEGIAASNSPSLTPGKRDQLTGEALAVRAFAYFYLVNFFGDLPLALTVDFNQTTALRRSPVNKIYDQIRADIMKARDLLPEDFSAGNGERVRINRWFAEALLARVSLYTGDFPLAIASATNVIGRQEYFKLAEEPGQVFLANSEEAIFQLKPTNNSQWLKNATPEGMCFLADRYYLHPSVPALFEAADKRRAAWTLCDGDNCKVAKYRIGNDNSMFMGPQTEYYTVMRLAEMYLIRAEALVKQSPANTAGAIADLNAIRKRANAEELPLTLGAEEVIEAVARERRLELFAEWGHRWMDLKRTGQAEEVLSAMSHKQPWQGAYQLLYPIPAAEIRNNNNLVQNPQYDRQ